MRIHAPIVAATIALAPAISLAAENYWIDESLDFTGNGCENTDLNDITTSFRGVLDSASWYGARYVNSDAWPQDFFESCSSGFGAGGLDSSAADSRLLTFMAGHGHYNHVQFSHQRSGICRSYLSTNIRLGTMAGSQAGYAIFGTSCTMNEGHLSTGAERQWLRQQFGFHNSPSIGNNSPSNFLVETNYTNNKTAWLEELEDQPGWFTGDNSPMVFTKDHTAQYASDVHNYNQILGPWWIPYPLDYPQACGAGQGGHYYYYTYRNNGGC